MLCISTVVVWSVLIYLAAYTWQVMKVIKYILQNQDLGMLLSLVSAHICSNYILLCFLLLLVQFNFIESKHS